MRIITDPDEARHVLEPWRAKHARPAWRPVTELGEGPVAGSRFGGRPALREGKVWPTCAECGNPQTLFLQLDLDTLPPEAGDFGGGLLQFFYCANETGDEDGAGHERWMPFSSGHLFRRIPAGVALSRPQLPDDGVYLTPRRLVAWDQTWFAVDEGDAPEFVDAEGLGLSLRDGRIVWVEQRIMFDAHYGDHFGEWVFGKTARGDKLGGWPHWPQTNANWIGCPRCGERMRLLMQIDSEDNVDFMFGDGGCGHVMQCPKHFDQFGFEWID